LLLVAADRARDRGTPLIPVTIDHGLRPESASEAEIIAERARRLGLAPVIIRWEDAKPERGLQAAARDFRLRSFARLAREHGAATILLGHTLDDQAETVWRRLLAGGGFDALSGMSHSDPLPLWPQGRGLRLVRPLLRVRRAALRDWLEARDERWIDDPSNENPAYSRVADRQVLARLERHGFDPARLALLAGEMRTVKTGEAETAARWLMENAVFHAWGCVSFGDMETAPLAALDAARAAVSGDPAPDRKAARQILNAVRARTPMTVAGVAVRFYKGGPVLIRDPGCETGRADNSHAGPALVRLGAESLWDGRFEITGRDIEVHTLQRRTPPGFAMKDIAGVTPLSRPGLPGVWKGDEFQGFVGLEPRCEAARWLAHELMARNLFGDRAPQWFHTQLRDQTAQGSH
jgi:tRNA(Ile)-lysidine synthase